MKPMCSYSWDVHMGMTAGVRKLADAPKSTAIRLNEGLDGFRIAAAQQKAGTFVGEQGKVERKHATEYQHGGEAGRGFCRNHLTPLPHLHPDIHERS